LGNYKFKDDSSQNKDSNRLSTEITTFLDNYRAHVFIKLLRRWRVCFLGRNIFIYHQDIYLTGILIHVGSCSSV